MVVIDGLAEVTNDALLQGAVPDNLIGVGSNENGRNCVPGIDQSPMELEPAYSRHVDVGHQAGGFIDKRR
jgi:hypothetical protein